MSILFLLLNRNSDVIAAEYLQVLNSENLQQLDFSPPAIIPRLLLLQEFQWQFWFLESKNMISAFPSISSGWQLKFPIQKICSIRGIPHFREWLHRDPVFTQNALQPLPLWWRRRWTRSWMRRWTLDKELAEDLDEEVDYICYL